MESSEFTERLMRYLGISNEGSIENSLFDESGCGRNTEITDEENTWIGGGSFFEKEITFISTSYWGRLDLEQSILPAFGRPQRQFAELGNLVPFEEMPMHVLSYDVLGLQATVTTSEDVRLDKKLSTVSQDYEYRQLGMVSLLTAIDLQTSEVMPLVGDNHSSKEYMELLKLLDGKYAKGDRICLVLDNLRVHTSDEIRRYLVTVPRRWKYNLDDSDIIDDMLPVKKVQLISGRNTSVNQIRDKLKEFICTQKINISIMQEFAKILFDNLIRKRLNKRIIVQKTDKLYNINQRQQIVKYVLLSPLKA